MTIKETKVSSGFIYAVRCDACGAMQEFAMLKPVDLILTMDEVGWSVPAENQKDYCPKCVVRSGRF